MPVLMRRPEITLSGYGATPACCSPLKSATRAKPSAAVASTKPLSAGVSSSRRRLRIGSGPARPRNASSPSGVFSIALKASSSSGHCQPSMPSARHFAKSAGRERIATAALTAELPPSVLPRGAWMLRPARPVSAW